MAKHHEHEPDWDLLEHDPEAFFGLEPGYDRKTLKRAYTRFLKRFKPEKFPDEFKLIRQAYEFLDMAFKDGFGNMRRNPVKPRSATRTAVPAGFDLDPLLDPAEVYVRLRDKQAKMPSDYHGLAILSDVFGQTETMQSWLLEGVTLFPSDANLVNLFHAWCASPGDWKALPAFLEQMVEKLGAGPFLRYSEVIWVRLSRKMSFEDWQAHLNRCSSKYRHTGFSDLLHFKQSIARRVFWRVDLSWIETFLNEVNEERAFMPEDMVDEIKLIELMHMYRKNNAEQFCSSHPFHQEIHDAIVAYCEEEDSGALIRFLSNFENRTDELMDAFPVYQQFSQPFLIMEWLVGEVDPSYYDEPEMPLRITDQVNRLIQTLENHTVARREGRRGLLFMGHRLAMGLVLVLSIGLGVLLEPLLGHLGSALVAFALPIGPLYLLLRGKGKAWRDKTDVRIARNAYDDIWRKEVMDFMKLSYHTTKGLINELESAEPEQRFRAHGFLVSSIRADYALEFLSLSRHFVW